MHWISENPLTLTRKCIFTRLCTEVEHSVPSPPWWGGTHFPLSPAWSPDFEIVGGKFGGDIPPMVGGTFFAIPPTSCRNLRFCPSQSGGDTKIEPVPCMVGGTPCVFGLSPPLSMWDLVQILEHPPHSGGHIISCPPHISKVWGGH